MTVAWKEVEQSETYDFEQGPLVGAFTGVETNVGPNESNLYSFELEDGRNVSVWGSTVLDSRMSKIQVGSVVKIEFLGEKENPKTNRTYKEFKVYTA